MVLPAVLAMTALMLSCTPGHERASGPGEDLEGGHLKGPLRMVETNLIAEHSVATVWSEFSRIELGQDESWPRLGQGWFEFSTNVQGGRGRWSMGPRSDVMFFSSQLNSLRITARCAPVGGAASLPTSFDVRVNDQLVETVELKEVGLTNYSFLVPAEVLELGGNVLSIIHRDGPRAGLSPSRDFRLVWHSLSFSRQNQRESQPAIARDQKALLLPFGTQIDYSTESVGESEVKISRLTRRGSDTGELLVSWQEEGMARPLLIATLSPKETEVRIPLPEGSGLPAKLSLLATAEGNREVGVHAGMVLRQPSLSTMTVGQNTTTSERLAPLPARPNILVYLIDTLRADHLGCYGYERPTTPNIDRFATESILFEQAQAQSPWTRASVASIFTGLWPQIHGVNRDGQSLSDESWTLAEGMQRAGYQTAAIVSNGNATRATGFAQGFDHFEFLYQLAPDQLLARSSDVNESVIRWLDARDEGHPFFLYAHTIDPHAPYEAPEPFRSRFTSAVQDRELGSMTRLVELVKAGKGLTSQQISDMVALYDAEVAANDSSFGSLLEYLDREGRLDDTVIVLMSDHGEEFYEHGELQHGRNLYSETLAVPFIVRMPGGKNARRVQGLVEHVDLLPTLLELIGEDPPTSVQGRSLVPELSGSEAAEPDNTAVAHMDLRGRVATSLIEEDWKAIRKRYNSVDGYPELYNRHDDPQELEDLGSQQILRARAMEAALKAIAQASRGGMKAGSVDPEAMREINEQLRALGYVQ